MSEMKIVYHKDQPSREELIALKSCAVCAFRSGDDYFCINKGFETISSVFGHRRVVYDSCEKARLKECLGAWFSPDKAINPSIFSRVLNCFRKH